MGQQAGPEWEWRSVSTEQLCYKEPDSPKPGMKSNIIITVFLSQIVGLEIWVKVDLKHLLNPEEREF